MDIRSRIREARSSAGISKSELARRVGVRPTSAIQWEVDGKGGTTPSVENLARIAVALDVRFEWLATGRGRMRYMPGVQDAPPGYAHSRDALAVDERDLLTLFRRRKPERRTALLDFLKRW